MGDARCCRHVSHTGRGRPFLGKAPYPAWRHPNSAHGAARPRAASPAKCPRKALNTGWPVGPVLGKHPPFLGPYDCKKSPHFLQCSQNPSAPFHRVIHLFGVFLNGLDGLFDVAEPAQQLLELSFFEEYGVGHFSTRVVASAAQYMDTDHY